MRYSSLRRVAATGSRAGQKTRHLKAELSNDAITSSTDRRHRHSASRSDSARLTAANLAAAASTIDPPCGVPAAPPSSGGATVSRRPDPALIDAARREATRRRLLEHGDPSRARRRAHGGLGGGGRTPRAVRRQALRGRDRLGLDGGSAATTVDARHVLVSGNRSDITAPTNSRGRNVSPRGERPLRRPRSGGDPG